MSDDSYFSFAPDQWLLRVLYLLLSFPLGILYFVSLITLICLGLGTLIIWVGIPILLLAILLWRAFGDLERRMTAAMLGAEIPPVREPAGPEGLWERFKAALGDDVTWKMLLYCLAKFPFGIVSFVFAVTFTAVPLAFLLAPLAHALGLPYHMQFGATWRFITFEESLLLALAGFLLGWGAMYLLNGLAYLWRLFAEVMLSPSQLIPAPPRSDEPVRIE